MEFLGKFLFWISLWVAVLACEWFSPNVINSGAFDAITFSIGVFLVCYGLLLNAVAGKTLKRFAHFDIKRGIRKSDKLVDFGIYSCMRHPALFGNIFFTMGLAFLSSKLIVIMFSGWLAAAGLYFMMAIEEKETLERFGEEYCEFLKRRKPFSFSVKCLLEGIKILRG